MTEPAGTPEVTPKGGTPEDSKMVEVSEQFKKEALESWKPAREELNKTRQELANTRAQLEQMQRASNVQAATDPYADALMQTTQMAPVDPVSRVAAQSALELQQLKAEMWLQNETATVPESKREQVKGIIRANGYQMSKDAALSMVTDPETKTLAEQLAEAKKEIERMKSAKSNGVSPAGVPPAPATDKEVPSTITVSEYAERLKAGGEAAKELMKAVGGGATRLTPG